MGAAATTLFLIVLAAYLYWYFGGEHGRDLIGIAHERARRAEIRRVLLLVGAAFLASRLLMLAGGLFWAWRSGDFAAYVRARGQDAFYGEMAVENRRRDGSFLNWVGFRCVHSAPHHTLTALLGRPIWRVTVLLKIEDLVC